MAGEEFRDNAEAIEIGCKTSNNDGGFFSTVEGCDAGEEPSGEKMSDRAHCLRERPFC